MSEDQVSRSYSRKDKNERSSLEAFVSKDMDMWPLLSLVSPLLQTKINLVYVYGPSGTEIIFTTVDNNVSFVVCCVLTVCKLKLL